MRLFYRPGTGRPMRVAWALEEAGASYEAVAVSSEEAGASDYRAARHPLGRVPALELAPGEAAGADADGGPVTLFDSTALVLQAADLFPDAGLIGPLGSVARGAAYQWCLTAMTELERNALRAPADSELALSRREAFTEAVQALADALGDHEFLVGDRFGVADIVVAGVLLVGERTGLVGGDANVAPDTVLAYLAQERARPAFARAAERTESIFQP